MVVAALCLTALSLLGLNEIRNANQEDTGVRVDRAGRSAAALLAAAETSATIITDDAGSPTAIVLADTERLAPGESWDTLLDTVGGVNQGAANLFRYSPATASFDRLSTTFRTPEGARVGGSQLEPGLIVAGHPAYASLVTGERYVGEVPVAGRLRLAYLTPIVTEQRETAGILAVDVGWVDDLNRINAASARRAAAATALLLLVLAAVGVVVMFCRFRPMYHLTLFANGLATGDVDSDVDLSSRHDEIGYLAQGLAKVASLQTSLRERAYTDNLTGIPNRAALVDELRDRFESMAEQPSADANFAVLVVDLDGFKEVNDGLGHQAGDEVLVGVAEALTEATGEGEFLARLGGDEFAVLSRSGGSTRPAATELASRLQAAITKTFVTSGGNARLEASIGICLVPQDATNATDALRLADLALYEVKRSGGTATQFYDPSLLVSFERRLFLTKELRLALATEGTITQVYQPLYDTTGRVRAVEALARWTHPVEGAIPPGEFVPLAESLGLVAELGTIVLDQACRQIADWQREFATVPCMSVNVSSMQLADPQFPGQVRAALDRHGIRPDQLCLEVTESVLIPGRNAPHRRVLGELVGMGLSLAIDDFGTGYSSLTYLHELVVDQVKLDRSFVHSVVDDPKQARLVKGIIGLAKNLDLCVVLEGVETERELAFGLANDCDLMQGFFLARPMSAEMVARGFDQTHPEFAQPREPATTIPTS